MDLVTRSAKSVLDNFGQIALIALWVASAVLLAWGVKTAGILAQYAPLNWVAACFAGAALATAISQMGASAHRQFVRNAYDAKLVARGGPVDPLARTFESKRIYLNEFALPSKPLIEDKTFIDCEIVGPANLVLLAGNAISGHRLPICDALIVGDDPEPSNGYGFRNCTFRGCSFVRITLMVTRAEFDAARNVDWLRWIGLGPEADGELLLDSSAAMGALPAPEEEARP